MDTVKAILSRLPVFLLWLLHFLPLPILARLGNELGCLLFVIARRRRRVVEVNLRLCFPDLDEQSRRQLAIEHFKVLARSLLERSLLWWSRPERLRALFTVEGEEHLRALVAAGRPVLLLTPHFVGLDAGGAAIAMRFNCASIYIAQPNPVFDRLLLRGRQRFGDQLLLSHKDSIRVSVRAMKAGRPLYYLPDMDFHSRDSIFVPFFGVSTATITGLSRLARLAGATVLPCSTRILPGGAGYRVIIGEPWADYPTDDLVADTARMNAWIESAIRTMPAQYYWVHRRFKTRPPGESKFY
ncbi:MAG TPA: lipid A biosynthesis acyltransferase [Accumulibacter sp.]|nr:lipid A biosynthesis acyltransferase [Accumulibacter sp.]HMW18222.1 lipid A biosynthesis acyltransferase [Accumulibacter sp.]HMX22842.1 lipid A biosynthesis acyltransferase [Accumulibacter sp.]HMY05853.1 lipid A biosynthesis acyltransferase [Accumulibacter sp.]HNC18345.1 lipid A biosynthesis acyltransferase [Accumulibacter sp.]